VHADRLRSALEVLVVGGAATVAGLVVGWAVEVG
jgi:hypothetical protein